MARKPKRAGRWRRRLLWTLGFFAVAVPGLWIAIHRIPWLGPALADGARAVLGPGPVAWIEDVAYAVADRINLVRFRNDKPKTYWETPPAAAPAPSDAPAAAASASPHAPPAAGGPAHFEPPFANVATDADGAWIPIADPTAPSAPPAMWKALVHPDPKRSFAAVAVVAVDLARVELHMVAGTQEPYSTTVPKEHRPGLVPPDQTHALLAVFNGGFKAEHGHYGMMLGGEIFLAPRDIACTIAFEKGGALRIRTWTELKDKQDDLAAWRQTPPCLVEQGSTHKALALEFNKNWGAAVGGETIIRRSAIGLDATGKLLFYGLGDAVTAQSLARAMLAVGAFDAAQLDVNYSYPRFLLYEHPGGGAPPKAKTGLIPDLKFTSWEYVSEASPRDFFYLTRKPDVG